MKFCQPHWDKLKAAIEARGLMSRVASSGEQAAAQLAAGKPDPLMAAHNAIVGNALGKVGLELMMPNEDGTERCPICFLVKLSLESPRCECGDPTCTPQARAESSERWIDHAADDQITPPEERT
jgi:hypothetical protein